jgi:PiT family inorganic phosphate transporter
VVVAVALAVAYGLLNGFHDAPNSIAAPVATRASSSGVAIALAVVFNAIGALVAGTAVATTVAGIVSVEPSQVIEVVGSALAAANAWGLVTWRWGFPSSSSHALVGGLAGAALAVAGPSAVHWGGMSGLKPVGVLGVLVWLALSTALAVPVGLLGVKAARRALRRATKAVEAPLRRSELVASSALSFSHGLNDSQKTVGVLVLLLVASGHLARFEVPLWVKVVAAATLAVGTAFGGNRIARTLARGIYRLRTLEGAVSQGSSAAIVLAASYAGAPVSSTDIVAPSIVGVGAGTRWRHVRWSVTEQIALSWIATLPATAALAAVAAALWRLA